VRLCVCGTVTANGAIVHLQMTHEWIWNSGEMILTGEQRRTGGKAGFSATLFTTNPKWTALGANPVLRGEKPATDHLYYSTAKYLGYKQRSVVPKVWSANPQGFAESSKGFARKQSILAAVLIVTDIIFDTWKFNLCYLLSFSLSCFARFFAFGKGNYFYNTL
jgi:hypothetical protein